VETYREPEQVPYRKPLPIASYLRRHPGAFPRFFNQTPPEMTASGTWVRILGRVFPERIADSVPISEYAHSLTPEDN